MDARLEEVLKKVIRLASENAEFSLRLRKALELQLSVNSSLHDKVRIEHIEKYLGLDYFVDSRTSIIDYSFIKIQDVRNLLISDNREMLRFRYGTRYHSINFAEFCRYAQLQLEMLLNYYYEQKYNGVFQDIVGHIMFYNRNAKIFESVKSLISISYNTKLYAFTNEFNIKGPQKNVLDYIRKVRNGLSHRSADEENFDIEEFKQKLISLGLPLDTKGLVDWNTIKENFALNDIYEKNVYRTDEYNLYCYLLWVKREPFDDVVDSLRSIAKICKDNIS